ncbi:MAG: hypothetical protein P4M15_09090 [Alphaproteobacteria bacterium]|nr:hypothetical protein [Alphaproteobacteria bacterium]
MPVRVTRIELDGFESLTEQPTLEEILEGSSRKAASSLTARDPALSKTETSKRPDPEVQVNAPDFGII